MTDFLGREIKGDITPPYAGEDVVQRTPEEFLERLDAVFAADPEVQAVQWHQYTPYFNDGEPCVFRAYIEAAYVGDQVPTDEFDYRNSDNEESGWIEEYDDRLYNSAYTMQLLEDGTRGKVYTTPSTDLQKAWGELDRDLSGGHFNSALIATFGDHARVLATREDFRVSFYEHE